MKKRQVEKSSRDEGPGTRDEASVIGRSTLQGPNRGVTWPLMGLQVHA